MNRQLNMCSSGSAAPCEPRVKTERQLVALVNDARAGDADAWRQLVARFDRRLRRIARSYRLSPADVDDVVQRTWLDLFEAISQIRDPMAIGGWLATVTRRNALRCLQAQMREEASDDPDLGDGADDHQPDVALLALERRAVLAAAITRLPRRHRDLMTVLLTQPALSYREITQSLSIPIGSIGPIRARSVARLARDPHVAALRDATVTELPRYGPSRAVDPHDELTRKRCP